MLRPVLLLALTVPCSVLAEQTIIAVEEGSRQADLFTTPVGWLFLLIIAAMLFVRRHSLD